MSDAQTATSTDSSESYTNPDYADLTAGALRVSRRHLKEAYSRICKAEDRLEYEEIGHDRGDKAWFTQSALAELSEEIRLIEDELDRRDEPYTA